MKYLFLLLSIPLIFPTHTHASEVYISPGEKTLIERMVDRILEVNTQTSSTSTTPTIQVDELTGLRVFETIETSTTTLTIEAPMIKLWQASGGIRSGLRSGQKNTEVVLLQGLLSAYIPEFRNAFISGFFGNQTREALKKFQKMYGVTQTGTVGVKTREVINSKYLSDLCPTKDGPYRFLENLNRVNKIEEDYVPPQLVVLPKSIRTAGIICLSKEPTEHLTELISAAKKAKHELIVLSGYRRFEVQKLLTAWNIKNNISVDEHEAVGLAEAGHSEHQLGTTVDFSALSLGYVGPSTKLGSTPEGKWLEQNSYKYGYIMSYPKGKEQITGYIYEPWHFRYVGVEHAKNIFERGLTIQEYLQSISQS